MEIEALIQDFVENGVILHGSHAFVIWYDDKFLYGDGVIRRSTANGGDARLFWPTKAEAETFFNEWKEKWK